MHILITAGPTREYIDPVRFITNGSTGKMGYACAIRAIKKGHRVTLITGPVTIAPPKGVKIVKALTSSDMAREVEEHYPQCDCVIMTAAVSDYKPAKTQPFKIRKTGEAMTLKLIGTTDILASLGRNKQNKILIGFAVQDQEPRQNASRKLENKNLDAIILNAPSAMGADKTDIQVLQRNSPWETHTNITKTRAAKTIISLAELLYDKHAK